MAEERRLDRELLAATLQIIENGTTKEDEEYSLIVESNSLVNSIQDETSNLYNV